MFYKILPAGLWADEIHYQLGVNVANPNGAYTQGLNYVELKHLCPLLHRGSLIAEVEPKGKIVNAAYYDMYATDLLYVHTIRNIADWFSDQSDETKQIIAEQDCSSVTISGFAIQLYKNPTEELKLAAVQRNGSAIKFIDNPSDAVQLAAVKNYSFAIHFIKNPSEEVQLAAIERRGGNIRYVKEPSEKVQLLAIRSDPYNIHYIENPTEKVQLLAIEINMCSIDYIKNPTEATVALFQKYKAESMENWVSKQESYKIIEL
jgi:hypothetical protein